MIVYVLTFEPYHENSTVLGAWTEEKIAFDALRNAPIQYDNLNPQWDDSDNYLLQEFDGVKLLCSWTNSNPYDHSRRPPVKLGWRIRKVNE